MARSTENVSVASETINGMWGPIIGSEAIAAGAISRGALRWNYRSVHPDVYLPKDAPRDLHTNAEAAWLWTRRTGVIACRTAAALHGVTWIGDTTPVELIATHGRRRPTVVIREERIGHDEVVYVSDLPVTSVARTALDIARHLDRDLAVTHLDALAQATGVTASDVAPLVDRYRGARGSVRAVEALILMNGAAMSPRETSVRLALIDAGFPTPATQLTVGDRANQARIAIGYEAPMVGVTFGAVALDIAADLGWTLIPDEGQHPRAIAYLVKAAVIERGYPLWRLMRLARD